MQGDTELTTRREVAIAVSDPVPYRWDAAGEVSASVLVYSMSGYIDAGQASKVAVSTLFDALPHRLLATFDADVLYDYRSRRPMITFDTNHWRDYQAPGLRLYEVTDDDGEVFLLLTGAEPDLMWERFAGAMRHIIERCGVDLVVGLEAVPMGIPHTRPATVTAHATRSELIADYDSWFDTIQIPASASAVLQLRLGEAGQDALGFVAHVPHYLAKAEYPEAARVLLANLSQVTGLALPGDRLRPAAERVMAQIDEQVQQSEEATELVRGLEQQYDQWAAAGQKLFASTGELPTADELGAEIERYLADRDD